MNQPQESQALGAARASQDYSATNLTAPTTSAGHDGSSLLGQATSYLSQGNMSELLGQLPQSVKDLSGQAVARFNRFSTTQKVVGGALLLLGIGALARGGKGGKKKQAKTLNELLYFVNDRIEGYKKAVAESQDAQLRDYYGRLVHQSQRFASELNQYLREQGGERQTSTTLKGKVYRRFMAAAATITGHDEKAILASNVHGEQWAIKAYKEALADDTLRGPVRYAVQRQYAQSQQTYEHLKKLTEQQQ